jgi:MoaA/NifB/PqqE/SkfB family radical SAM enzyme
VLSSHHIFDNQRFPVETFSFGNIHQESLTHIWHKKEYVEFRNLFDPETVRAPEQIGSQMPQRCLRCYKRLGA